MPASISSSRSKAWTTIPWQAGLYQSDPYGITDGEATVTDAPGWGVEIDPNWLETRATVSAAKTGKRGDVAEIVLDGVTKRFGATLAVDHVNPQIADGEFMVFVGPSGCGKSTTLRMIAGLETTSEGTIRIGERDVTRLEPKQRNVAMVFQNYALYAHKNVYDNLGFGLKVRGTGKDEIDQRVRHAAAMLGIEELLQRKPRQLSGGQMQRVALGRALVREPDVFLLDEPLSNLDAKMRVRMREEIAKLHAATGSSMIYVTHDQVEAMTLGDRIASCATAACSRSDRLWSSTTVPATSSSRASSARPR